MSMLKVISSRVNALKDRVQHRAPVRTVENPEQKAERPLDDQARKGRISHIAGGLFIGGTGLIFIQPSWFLTTQYLPIKSIFVTGVLVSLLVSLFVKDRS